MKIEDIKKLRHYANIEKPSDGFHEIEENEDIVKEQDAIITEIFAPDPDTGLPSSDLHLVLNKDTRPEIRAYIEQNLMSPRSTSAESPADNPDVALDLIKDRRENVDQYKQRLLAIASRGSEKPLIGE